MIEVEQHFAIGPATREKLTSLGAAPHSKEEFTDIYYDTADLKLMTSYHYLRRRNGQWQLKYAVINSEASWSGAGTTERQHSGIECNYELEDVPAIITQLRNVVVIDKGTKMLSHLIEEEMLLPVAEYSTMREKWVWPDKRMGDSVSIELDEASFNYALGSVEVMVGVAEEVPAAESIARDIAGKIGNKQLTV